MERNRFDKMSQADLRRLSKNIERTLNDVLADRQETLNRLCDLNVSMKKTDRLRSRVLYWLGKKRAEKCPAFKDLGHAFGKCMIHSPSHQTHFKSLFLYRCAHCKLKRETRLRKGVLNGVFGRRSG